MICVSCGCEYEKWIPDNFLENNLCISCNKKSWDDWEKEYSKDIMKIKKLREQGHSLHCACRQIFGDGECLCN